MSNSKIKNIFKPKQNKPVSYVGAFTPSTDRGKRLKLPYTVWPKKLYLLVTLFNFSDKVYKTCANNSPPPTVIAEMPFYLLIQYSLVSSNYDAHAALLKLTKSHSPCGQIVIL